MTMLGTIGSIEPEHSPADTTAPAAAGGLGTGTAVVLGATVVPAVLRIIADVNLYRATGGYLDLVDVSQLPDRLDQVVAFRTAVRALYWCVFLICAAIFLAWFRRARRSVPGPRRHAAAWATVAWFLPVAWWFVPRRIAVDILDGLHTDRSAADAWWTFWVGFSVVSLESAVMSLWTDPHNILHLRSGAIVDAATTALGIGAAIAAIAFVRRVESCLRRLTAGAPAPHAAA